MKTNQDDFTKMYEVLDKAINDLYKLVYTWECYDCGFTGRPGQDRGVDWPAGFCPRCGSLDFKPKTDTDE